MLKIFLSRYWLVIWIALFYGFRIIDNVGPEGAKSTLTLAQTVQPQSLSGSFRILLVQQMHLEVLVWSR